MRCVWLALAAAVVGPVAACYADGDGYDTRKLPEDLRSDYAVFAQRCSRCHSLSRPLSADVDDDVFWKRYVEQMRLKPGSGISVSDEAPILRFLHYYMLERRRRSDDAPSVAPSAVAPQPPPPPPPATSGVAP